MALTLVLSIITSCLVLPFLQTGDGSHILNVPPPNVFSCVPLFFLSFKDLFILERQRACVYARGHPIEEGAQCGARSQDPAIAT